MPAPRAGHPRRRLVATLSAFALVALAIALPALLLAAQGVNLQKVLSLLPGEAGLR